MNSELTELINIKRNDATKEDDAALIEELKNARLILPIEITSDIELDNAEEGDIIELDEGFRFKPIKIVDDNGRVFIPLYSDDSQVHGHTSAINIYAKDLARMIDDNPENIFGVVLNPFSKFNVELPMDTFLKIFEDEN
ncbi:MAG: SseB family protein [Methanobrevibacter sp.]|nr:SseB family protein [Methanobrevibacter sp.]